MGSNFINTIYGLVSSTFAVEKLGKLCMDVNGVQTGPFGSQLHASDYVDEGIPIITVEHLGDNRIIHENLPRVREEDKKRLEKYTLRTGDIVVSRVGSVDRRAIVHPTEEGWLFSGRCLRVRPDPQKIDSGYLSWFFGLLGFREYIRQIAVGATMPSLNTTILSNVPIYYPKSIQEQKTISYILETLNSKIECNYKMNKTLETMIRVIFKSWFVNFDPVRRCESEQKMLNVGSHLVNLFPNKLGESELGDIPGGWCVRSIGDVAQVLGGGTPSTKEPSYWGNGVHSFCTPKDMSSLISPALLETERYLTKEGLAKVSSGQLPPGTVLLSSRAPIGYLAISEIPVSINQGIIAIVCDKDLPNLYVLPWLRENMDRIIARANGSTFLEISKSNFRSMPILVPPSSILKEYCQVVEPLYRRMVNNLNQIKMLAATRDTLLPKLISGELRVRRRSS